MIQSLDRATCHKLLGYTAIGRVAWAGDQNRVEVRPVNFILDGETIVFRTTSGAKLDAVRQGRPLTFETDDVEPALRTGWSIIATGPAEIVTDPEEIRRLQNLPLAPWAPAPAPHFVRLTIHEITGRRLPLHPGGVSIEHLSEPPE